MMHPSCCFPWWVWPRPDLDQRKEWWRGRRPCLPACSFCSCLTCSYKGESESGEGQAAWVCGGWAGLGAGVGGSLACR